MGYSHVECFSVLSGRPVLILESLLLSCRQDSSLGLVTEPTADNDEPNF